MPTTTEKEFEDYRQALKSNKIEDITKILQNLDVTATTNDGWTFLMLACGDALSPEVMKLVLEKIFEVGGKDLLQSQIISTNNKGSTCLMSLSCSNSPEVVKVVVEKILEVGGEDLLKSQLTAANSYNSGYTCLMLGCHFSSSPEVVNVFTEKIREAGGEDLLKSQLTATNSDGQTCLMLSCGFSLSPEVVKVVVEKILEVGGEDLLKSQLTATENKGRNCLILSCYFFKSSEVVKLVAAVLFKLSLFNPQCEKLDEDDRKKLKDEAGIESSSWAPDAEILGEVHVVFEKGNFMSVIHGNHAQVSQVNDFPKNNESAKLLIDSNLNIIIKACFDPKTPLKTLKLLFSYIKRIGGNESVKQLLAKENGAGESCVLAICLSHDFEKERLELFMDTMEEAGERFLAEQIAKKRQRDGMTCLYALCESKTAKYDSFSLLVSKILQLERGRHLLAAQCNANSSLEIVMSRPLDSPDDMKFLCLIVGLYSITGLFKDQYSRFDEEQKLRLRRICKIESGDWSRGSSIDSTMGDVIGEIKKSTL